MENQPKKRGRKVGSKKNNTENKEPPKKRGRKPKKKIITNENPVFADDNLNMEDLIIKLNNDKNDQENNLSFTIDEHEEINYDKKINEIISDGKTYFNINDYDKLRDLFGELLRETQRIKSEGDYESAEKLEQLRAIDNGIKISAIIKDYESISIDTEKDLKNLIMSLNSKAETH